MAATVISDCPHCFVKMQAHQVVGHKLKSKSVQDAGHRRRRTATIAAICNACEKIVGFDAKSIDEMELSTFNNRCNALMAGHEVVQNVGFEVRLVVPPVPPQRLLDLPESIQKSLDQAETNFHLPACEEAAATMYRRALERALKEAHPETTGSLYAKIRSLADDHVLPGALAEWAHEIRLDGNDGAHDEGVSRVQLEATRAFADALLRYLIVLPKMVEARRAAAVADDVSAADQVAARPE